MGPDWVSNTGPLVHELDALPTALRGPALKLFNSNYSGFDMVQLGVSNQS